MQYGASPVPLSLYVVTKWRRIRWVRHVAHVEEKKLVTNCKWSMVGYTQAARVHVWAQACPP
jgi:hypothetical protein